MRKRPNNIKHTFHTKEEFDDYIVALFDGKNYGKLVNIFNNIRLRFDISIPYAVNQVSNNDEKINSRISQVTINYSHCEFEGKVDIRSTPRELKFNDKCWFRDELKIRTRDKNISFKNCEISNLNLEDAKFGKQGSNLGKLRIKSCIVNKSNFKNATFYALVDFYYTVFTKNVVFYKTDFLNIIVLSATTFKANLLFTYTLLSDKVIMRSTQFKKGFDFSLAIIKGQLAIFNIEHDYKAYEAIKDPSNEKEYEKAVSEDGLIPLQNKLETYRILKVDFEKQQNIPESLKFKRFEKRTYKHVLSTKKNSWDSRIDKATLWLNRWSNKHGTSAGRALVFTLGLGLFFFYFSAIASNKFSWSGWEWSAVGDGIGYFFQFLIPTHKFSYLETAEPTSNLYYILDFLGRIAVGYGIYQFIQAFRKFR